MAAVQSEVVIQLDSSPLKSFLEILQTALEVRNRPLGQGDLPTELGRVDSSDSTSAGELRVSLYPSDALLRFASALWTGKSDGDVVE